MSASKSVVVHGAACMYMLFIPSVSMKDMFKPRNGMRGKLTLEQLSKGVTSFVQVWTCPDELEDVDACSAALRQQGAGAVLSRAAVIWLKYCVASRCLAMIVAEQSTEALPPHHRTRVTTNFWESVNALRSRVSICARVFRGSSGIPAICPGRSIYSRL
jgi:hypothetical protein